MKFIVLTDSLKDQSQVAEWKKDIRLSHITDLGITYLATSIRASMARTRKHLSNTLANPNKSNEENKYKALISTALSTEHLISAATKLVFCDPKSS